MGLSMTFQNMVITFQAAHQLVSSTALKIQLEEPALELILLSANLLEVLKCNQPLGREQNNLKLLRRLR